MNNRWTNPVMASRTQVGHAVATICVLSTLAFSTSDVAASAFGDNPLAPVDLEGIAASAPGIADYPDADAVDLYWATDWRVDDQGRVVRREHRVRKLLTPYAVRNLSDLRVPWDSARQELHVEVCRTLMRDGTEVVTPPRGLNEVTPDAVARAADFLAIREMVISHVGTEPGCVTELLYEIRDLAAPILPVGGRIPHAGRFPVLQRRIVVATPAPVAYAVVAVGDVPTPTTERIRESGCNLLLSSANDVAPVPPEGAWPDRLDVVQHLVFATATSWDAVEAAWRRAGAAASADTTGVARWLVTTKDRDEGAEADLPLDLSPLAPVRRVATVIGDRLATVHLPTGPWSRAPRSVAQVLSSGVATAWEKGIVAHALLAATGLNPEIGFFTPGSSYAADVPTAASFQQVRVVLPAAGENWWLAPGRDKPFSGRCDLAGRTGLFLEASGTGYRTYTVNASPARAWLAVVIRPASDEDSERPWLAEIEYDATGALWPAGESGVEIAEKLAAAVLPGGEVGAVDEEVVGSNRGRLRLTARAPALVETAAGSWDLRLPEGPVSMRTVLPAGNALMTSERRTPLHVAHDIDWQLRLRLELPDSLTADHLPPAVERSVQLENVLAAPDIESPSDTTGARTASAHLARRIESKDRRCELHCTLTIPAGWVAPAQVNAWREVVRESLLPSATTIVLTRP